MTPFSRFDFAATRCALALVAVATPVIAVGLPLLAWVRGRPLEWVAEVDPERGDLTGITTSSPGTHVSWTGEMSVSLADAPTSVWVYSLLPGVVLSVAVVVVALLLFRLTGRVQRSRAFVADSVRSLRIIAFVIVMGWLCSTIAGNLAGSAVLESALPDDPHSLTVTVLSGGGLAMLLTGLLVGVIGEAFAQGARLADDVEGLV